MTPLAWLYQLQRKRAISRIPEPPPETVVLDTCRVAWQRFACREPDGTSGSRWAAPRRDNHTWHELNVALGPLTIIHTPEQS